MIRRFSFIIIGLACVAVLAGIRPVFAQSGLFLKKGEQAQEKEESSKPGFYIPFFNKKKPEKGVFIPEKRTVKRLGASIYQKAKDLDVRLLSMRGPPPQSSAELRQLAAAHNAPKMAAMYKQRQETLNRLAQMNNVTPRVSKTEVQAKPSEKSQVKAQPKTIYNTGDSPAKPKKVFSDYR